MDPDTALEAVRQGIADYRQLAGKDPEGATYAVETLVDHIEALDEWMSFGGWAPAAWRGKARSAESGQ